MTSPYQYTLPPLPLIDGKLYIDNSGSVEGFSTCYRYLEYKTLHKRILGDEKPALNFGSAMHLVMEYRYSQYQNRSVDQQFYDVVGVLLEQFFAKHPSPADDWRTLNWAMEMTRQYNDKYATESFSLLKLDEPIACPQCRGAGRFDVNSDTPLSNVAITEECVWCRGTGKRETMVEMPYALPLYTHKIPAGQVLIDASTGKVIDEIQVVYTGRIDLPIFLDGELYVMDHKSTGQMGQQFWDEMRMTAQQKGYVWAFTSITKRALAGYVVNGIRSKAPPMYVANGSPRGKLSPAQWWNESFARERFRTDWDSIEEWKFNLIDIIEEFFWHHARGYMPMKTKWCTVYGKCPYYDICRLPHGDRHAMLRSGQFTDNVWSPLNQPTESKQ